jgi:hypothetical protein
MSDPVARHLPDPDPDRRLYRYEMRVRTTMGRPLTSSFQPLAEGAVVPRHAVRRLALIRDDADAVDLPAVMERLTACDVAVLDARLCRPPVPRSGQEP